MTSRLLHLGLLHRGLLLSRSRRSLPTFWSLRALWGALLLLLLLSASASANPQVPQGGSTTFAPASGGSYPGATWTWQILSPSGTQIATNTTPNGWSVSFQGSFTVGAPSTATIATGYTVDYNNSGSGPYAYFDVIASSVTVSSLTLSPTTVVGGNTGGTQSQGTVTLSAAPASNVTVSLTSSNTNVATVPGTVTILAGTINATFPVNTSAVSSQTTVTFTALSNGVSKTATLTVNPWLLSFTATSPVIGGNASTGTITLNAPAPSGGLTVALSSDNTAVATVPANTVVPAGSSTGPFAITTSAVTTTSSANITVTYGSQGIGQSVSVQPWLSSLVMTPNSVTGGTSSSGKVTLNANAPSGGIPVSLSSTNSAASVPASVTVPQGSNNATFTATTTAATTVTTGNITASYASVNRPAPLTVNPIQVSVAVNPTSLIGGNPSTGTVTLSGPAPTGGITVALSSSNTGVATVPASVPVAAGATTATFTVTTASVTSTALITIQASYGGLNNTATLTVNPWLQSVSVSGFGQIVSGQTATGTVTLNAAAPAGGIAVTLSSSNTNAATVPASVTVPQGSSTATFIVTAGSVGTSTPVTLTATYASAPVTANVTILPLLSSVSVAPSSVGGGTSATGTVTLAAAAPTGGITVTLSSSNTGVATVPASVPVAANATSATFTVTTVAVSATKSVTLTASYGGASPTTPLTVVPLLSSVTFNSSTSYTIAASTTVTGTVTLSGPAPAGGITVTLSSSNTGVATVPASIPIAANATSGTFTATGAAVTTSGTATITAGYGGATQTAYLTVVPLLSSLSVTPSTAVGPDPATGTVSFGIGVPAGASITLTSSNPAVASVSSPLTPTTGAYSAQFNITTTAVSTATQVTLTAAYGGVSKQTTLTVNPVPTVQSIIFTPSELVYSPTAQGSSGNYVAAGPSTPGTILLTGIAPKAGATITLSSNNGAATVPVSVPVSGGSNSATFTATIPGPVATSTTVTVTGSYNSSTKTGIITVDRPPLTGLSFSPSTVGGGNGVTGTVTLLGPAPAGGVKVDLSVSPTNSASINGVALPTSVTIPAGQASTIFPETTSTVNSPVTLTFTASNDAYPGDAPVTASVNLVVATLHDVDLFMPKTIYLQWYLSAVGNFLITRNNNDGTGNQTLTSTLANTATSYYDVFPWNSGQTYTYNIYDNNNPASPILLSTENVVPYLVNAAQDQAVDSRLDPRYATNVFMDHNFGVTAYKGGLFAGFDNDPARIGRSFAQFNLNAYPANGVFRTGKVNAYFVTADNTKGPVNLQVGCQNVGTGTWNASTLTWDAALTAFPAFNPASAPTPQIQTFKYDPSVPWLVAATPTNGQVTLTWNPPLTGAGSSYTVSYGTQSGYYTSQVTGIAANTATITGLTNGTTYYFVVAAVNSGQTGSNSSEVSMTPPSGPVVSTPPTVNYWASWPLLTDIQNTLTGSNHLLTVGWASMNEATPNWGYFAKAEYNGGSNPPSVMHAWSLPTLVLLQVPASVALGGQPSTSATALLTVNAIGLTGSAPVTLSATDSGGNATSLISVPSSLTVTGLTRTFPVTITSGAAGHSFLIKASFNGVTLSSAMNVTP